MENKTKFLKVWHENQVLGERNEGQEKIPHCHRIAARLGERTTPTIAPHPCASDEMTIGFFCHRNCPYLPPE